LIFRKLNDNLSEHGNIIALIDFLKTEHKFYRSQISAARDGDVGRVEKEDTNTEPILNEILSKLMKKRKPETSNLKKTHKKKRKKISTSPHKSSRKRCPSSSPRKSRGQRKKAKISPLKNKEKPKISIKKLSLQEPLETKIKEIGILNEESSYQHSINLEFSTDIQKISENSDSGPSQVKDHLTEDPEIHKCDENFDLNEKSSTHSIKNSSKGENS